MKLLIAVCGLVVLFAATKLVPGTASAVLLDPKEAGDADCSGTTTAADALVDIRYIANPQDANRCVGAGNVICGDGITLADVQAILRYVAELSTSMPPPCPQIGSKLAGTIVSQGELTIKGTYDADFDDGVANTESGDPDVFWEQITETKRQMVPTDARLALVDGRTFDSIGLPYLYSRVFTTDPINGNDDATNQLSDGSIFAVQTSRGNYTKAMVTHYDYNITIKWVTYTPD